MAGDDKWEEFSLKNSKPEKIAGIMKEYKSSDFVFYAASSCSVHLGYL